MGYIKQQIKGRCLECANEFIGNSLKRYCSKQCKNVSHINKKLEKEHKEVIERRIKLKQKKEGIISGIKLSSETKEKLCKNCNKLFTTKKDFKIFCSGNCRNENYKKKMLLIPFEERINKNTFLKLRFELFKRDNFQCQYCGRTPKKDKCKLVIDHIIPKNKGGINEINNLITSCFECNAGKIDILLEERQLNKLEVTYE